MKTASLSLALLFAGCLNNSQEVYVPQNTELSTNVEDFTALASQIQHAGFSTYKYLSGGVETFVISLRTSSSPFPCGADAHNQNYFDVELVSQRELSAGGSFLVRGFEANLIAQDDFFSAFAYEAPDSQLQGSLSIIDIDSDSFTGVLDLRVSSELFDGYTGQIFGDVLFSLALIDVPTCDPAAYN